MDIIEQYIDELMEKSTPEEPIWNIERILQGKKADWNYVDGCMIKAILEMYAITKDEKYLNFADGFIDYRVHEDGTIDGYDVEELNIDNINAGKTLFELYDLTGKEKYRRAIDLVYSQIEKMPRTREGNFWHKNIYPNQVWLDGLYMCQPFYMEYETRFNGKKNYDDIYNQFFNVVEKMRDSETGLYYHAYDSSREMFWCDKVTGLSQNFWLRALGWYSMALLDTMDKADSSVVKPYERMKEIFKDLIDSLLRYQDESGMWYQVVNLGGMDRNYLETSGSAILSYAILKGVRLGFLPEEYIVYGKKAFEGICERYLHTEEGNMSLGGICLVAGLGGNGRRSGTYDYYMSEPVVKDDAKGVGPFLLAYTEMRRLGEKENGGFSKGAGTEEVNQSSDGAAEMNGKPGNMDRGSLLPASVAVSYFKAMERDGEELYREAVDRVMEQLESGEGMETSAMPFYAAYDTKYRKKEHYDVIVALFEDTLQKNGKFSGREMADLIDTLEQMGMEIYEYYRALCDMFRQQVRENGEASLAGMEACEMAYAILKGCNLGVIQSEKYAPCAVAVFKELESQGRCSDVAGQKLKCQYEIFKKM